jgi:hypothetical protein
MPQFRATLRTVYASVTSRSAQLKKQCQDASTQMAAGNVSGNLVRQILDGCITAKAEFAAAAQVQGLAEYAQAQEGDPNYDVVAAFTDMSAAIDTILTTIIALIPTSGGYVLMETWTTSGVTTRIVTPAQSANLRTALDAFVATVG